MATEHIKVTRTIQPQMGRIRSLEYSVVSVGAAQPHNKTSLEPVHFMVQLIHAILGVKLFLVRNTMVDITTFSCIKGTKDGQPSDK